MQIILMFFVNGTVICLLNDFDHLFIPSQNERLKTESKTEFVQLSSTCALSFGKWATVMVSTAVEVLLCTSCYKWLTLTQSVFTAGDISYSYHFCSVDVLSILDAFTSSLSSFYTASTLLCSHWDALSYNAPDIFLLLPTSLHHTSLHFLAPHPLLITTSSSSHHHPILFSSPLLPCTHPILFSSPPHPLLITTPPLHPLT
jgi:hypothetical protein